MLILTFLPKLDTQFQLWTISKVWNLPYKTEIKLELLIKNSSVISYEYIYQSFIHFFVNKLVPSRNSYKNIFKFVSLIVTLTNIKNIPKNYFDYLQKLSDNNKNVFWLELLLIHKLWLVFKAVFKT